MAKIDYTKEITEFIDNKDGLIDFQSLAEVFDVSPNTVRIKLKEAMASNPSLQGRIAGVFPSTSTIIDAVETKIGNISGSNLVQANLESRKLVENWSKSFAEHFCKKALGDSLNTETMEVHLTLDELRNKLLEPYEDYLTQTGNGLVSIAGTLNQSLLIRALRTAGLKDDGPSPNFKETGKKSEGDIHIYHRGKSHRTLSVEAKSYAARERLLRGLADIPTPKVGVGFFNDASEFNVNRVTLLATAAHTSGLYMPQETYLKLTPEAQSISHAETGRICRSLEIEFIEDMVCFVNSGIISKRNP